VQFSFVQSPREAHSRAFNFLSRRHNSRDFVPPFQCHEDNLSADLVEDYRTTCSSLSELTYRKNKKGHTTGEGDPRHLSSHSSSGSRAVVSRTLIAREFGFIRGRC